MRVGREMHVSRYTGSRVRMVGGVVPAATIIIGKVIEFSYMVSWRRTRDGGEGTGGMVPTSCSSSSWRH